MIRFLCALVAVVLTCGASMAADLGPRITTTDGCQYVRQADGHYYPVNGPQPTCFQRPEVTGWIVPNTITTHPLYYLPQQSGCENGQCGIPTRRR